MEIKYIVMAFIAIALFVFIFNFKSGKVGEEITGGAVRICQDSDGGIVAGVVGTVLGYEDPYKAKTDFCINKTTLGEYYCDYDKSDGLIKDVYCEDGCSDSVCVEVVEDEEITCEQGCIYQGKCVPIGIRVNGKYCHWDSSLKEQIEGKCESSYECKSNLCVANKCLEESEWDNFLEDIKVTRIWE